MTKITPRPKVLVQAEVESNGAPIGPNDSMIAGAALARGLMLGRAGSVFAHHEVEAVRGLIPALAVGLAAILSRLPGSGCPLASARVTAREEEVLRLVQLGYTNPEIARALGTSPNTVRNQVSSLLQKMGATTRAELVGLTLQVAHRA